MTDHNFFVGIDLGTYKTSIVGSRGLREVLPTAVGWPKDMIARSVLGADAVFGDQLEGNRLALKIMRPLAKGALKYVSSQEAGLADEQFQERVRAVALLVRHAVSLMNPPPGARVLGAIGAPSRATAENKQFLLEAARAAMDTALIIHEPFAVAYGMHRLQHTLVVDIGAGTTDICPMYGSYTAEADQLTLPIGGDHIDASILERMAERYPEVRISEHVARQIKEKYGTVRPGGEPACVPLPEDKATREVDMTDILFDACHTIVTPIVAGIRQVTSRFDADVQRQLLDNVLLAGGGSQLAGLDVALEKGLRVDGPGQVTKVHDAVFAGATGALKLAMDMPPEQWDKVTRYDRNAAA